MSMSSLETRIESMSSVPTFLPTSTLDAEPLSHSVAAPGVGVVFKANLIKRDYKVLVTGKNGENLEGLESADPPTSEAKLDLHS